MPSRRRPTPSSHHVLSDCGLADLNAELAQFAMDPRRTPKRVGDVHLPNQVSNLASYWRASRTPAPEQAKALAVPLDDCGWLDQHHRVQTARPQSAEPDPRQAVDRNQSRASRPLATKNSQLMRESKVLQFQDGSASESAGDNGEDGPRLIMHAEKIGARKPKTLDF
jgi:hypothetical protein